MPMESLRFSLQVVIGLGLVVLLNVVLIGKNQYLEKIPTLIVILIVLLTIEVSLRIFTSKRGHKQN